MDLQYTFTNDILFKMLFVQYPMLLKKLVAELLGIQLESIEEFVITNPEIPPEAIDDKFCRLDVNMSVDGQLVDLEIQVRNEGDYPERVLYYWAREYGTALTSGGDYKNLPRTVIISILNFNLFACADFHSEFQALEVTRHEPLSDKMSLHFFELRKLPKAIKRDDRLKVWLSLFRAKTEEELQQIEALEVPEMKEAIEAYYKVTAEDKLRELERSRHYAEMNRSSSMNYAIQGEREKWKGVVAEKDAVIAGKDTALAEKDTALAENAALIAELRARLGEKP